MAKVLIIEDEEQIRLILKKILEMSDFDVLVAPNGLEGTEIAKHALPDIILCDIMMPVLNGHQVLKILKEDSLTATIPFIFLTAKSNHINIREGMNLGADDYLVKPIKSEELLACIQTRIEKSNLQRQRSEAQLKTLRSNLSRSMPHELNTPLNGILGLARILSKMPDPKVKKLSNGILESGERLQTTISKFLVYAELELARFSPEESSFLRHASKIAIVPITEVIAERIAARTNRSPDLQLKLQAGSFFSSSFFYEQLLEELIDNAFKFSDSGNSVIVSNTWDNDWFTLNIQDHGRSMKPEQIAEVAAYMQFERKIYEQQGMGLGLVIAKYIAELQGGTLSITSDSNVGTEVEVKLPRQSPLFSRC